MKAKGTVILPDGIACSGKSTYSRKISKERGAVLLIVDEILLTFGVTDFASMGKAMGYVNQLAADIASAGADVVLESGYFKKEERDRMKQYFKDRDIPYEWRYLDVSDETWRKNIALRNAAHANGETNVYPMDEAMVEMFEKNYTVPERDEVDVWIDNNW